MEVLTTVAALREQLQAGNGGRSVGCVPTMGALHRGHLELLRRARAENDCVVVTLFVNPTQFGPNEDFLRYPRPFEADREACEAGNVDFLFAPSPAELYPPGYRTYVSVEGLSDRLCGVSRPGHFRGVATVVAKLLEIVRPDRAYFGEKDFQQLAVIRQMVRDLNMPVSVVPMPTVRDSDGLALSSRNAYMSPEERAAAAVIPRALQASADLFQAGERSRRPLLDAALGHLMAEPLCRLDYLELADQETLEPVESCDRPAVMLVAAYLGKTRLIDNVRLGG